MNHEQEGEFPHLFPEEERNAYRYAADTLAGLSQEAEQTIRDSLGEETCNRAIDEMNLLYRSQKIDELGRPFVLDELVDRTFKTNNTLAYLEECWRTQAEIEALYAEAIGLPQTHEIQMEMALPIAISISSSPLSPEEAEYVEPDEPEDSSTWEATVSLQEDGIYLDGKRVTTLEQLRALYGLLEPFESVIPRLGGEEPV